MNKFKDIEYLYTSFDFTKSWGDSEYRQYFNQAIMMNLRAHCKSTLKLILNS